MNYNNGYLTIYIGGCRSGKSAMGISKYIHYDGLKRFKVVMVIPDWSIRKEDPMYIVRPIPYLTIGKEMNSDQQFDQVKEYDVIIIDECQFYQNLREVVIRLLNIGKIVYLCGLDGDFNGDPFGETLSLIPMCDEIHKLKGDCVECVNEGRTTVNASIRTIRVDGDPDAPIVEIAGLEKFKPVCREHCGSEKIPLPGCCFCKSTTNS